jgi:hypothetical protein
MNAARVRTLATRFAAIAVPSAAAIGVVAGALADRGAAARARVELAQARASLEARSIDGAAKATRGAALELQPMLDGPWYRHAWSRTAGRAELEALRGELAQAVARLEAAIEARRARVLALEAMRAEVGYAATVSALDAVEARRAQAAAELELDAPAAHADLVTALADRRRGFAADIARNRAAVEAVAVARELARGDAVALQAVADAVLPVAARAGEDIQLGELRASAAAERAAILASGRVAGAEREAATAVTAAAAAAVAERLERDPDLRRGATGELAERRAAAIAAARRRQRELEAWERSVLDVDAALAADEPAAAARALSRLAPCDGPTRAEAGRIRAAFGARALDGLLRAALGALERSDGAALARLAAPFAPGGAVRPYLEGATLADADRVRLQVDRACDRDLYEQFRRSPSAAGAERYLSGWPAVRRAMAPAVLAWRRAASEAGTTVALQELRWGSLGLAAVNRGLEDRPDARVAVFVNGSPAADLRVGDIRDGGTNGVNDVVLRAGGFPWEEVEVGVLATIDLRDAILADPRPRGSVRQPVAAWRSDRSVEVQLVDPAWAGCRHVAVFGITVPKTPPLPPFQGRQQ